MVDMSEILETMPGNYYALKPHPFDLWADGRIHKLTAGKDYRCARSTMERQLRRQGQKRNKLVKVRHLEDGIAVQFMDR